MIPDHHHEGMRFHGQGIRMAIDRTHVEDILIVRIALAPHLGTVLDLLE
jgi:hypothetical protein